MKTDTITALATPQGVGAIAVIRLSGSDAIAIANSVFVGKNLEQLQSHTIHFGTIRDKDRIIDEVLVSIFKEPRSFTQENVVEISTHGSQYIVTEVIKLLLKHGARLAKPGEFTQRAFLNGQYDLAQAEAIADLIHSETATSHQAAISQMRGGFSKEIAKLRTELIHFASLIELELDFSEEDLDFANRNDLKELIIRILSVIDSLIRSFELGNVIKNGVPTVIAGKPNAGKSTLLNALLNEERSIVSEIAGTTRDAIEDEINIEGINFRFIDTAGLRDTTDTIEAIGVQRTYQKMKEAALIIYIFDLSTDSIQAIDKEIKSLEKIGKPYIIVGNKIDKIEKHELDLFSSCKKFVLISATENSGIERLKSKLLEYVNLDKVKDGATIITNIRHYDNLQQTNKALEDVLKGLENNITGDFLAQDIRHSLHYLGEITGEITTDDLLDNIFSKFCIGK